MPTIDLTTMILDTVNETLDKMGIRRTAENQIEVLNGMHKQVFSDGKSSEIPMLRAIEDELIRLSDGKL